MSGKEHSIKLVIFHRFKYIPNLSAFVVKVETFMRLANIKYDVEVTKDFSSNKDTNKLPFAIIDGVQVNDSQKIISRISELYGVDLDSGLSPVEKAISHAFLRMVDEFTYWTYIHWRYVDQTDLYIVPDIWDSPEAFGISPDDPDKIKKQIEEAKKWMGRMTYAQGVGRKPTDEIYKDGIADLRAVSVYLGDKPFMFGDKPTIVDCALFGHLIQIVYLPFPTMPQKIMVENECKNLVEFCHRMKALAWPDWDQLTK